MRNGTTVQNPVVDWQDEIELDANAIERRLRWAREHGHPHYLWPDVPPEQWRAALAEVERVTRGLMGQTPGVRLNAEDEARLRTLSVAAFTSGMGPLLGWWIEQGQLYAGERARSLLALHLEHGRERAARMLTALREVICVLDEAGVAATVLKGAHTAHVWFPESGLRPMSDLDLLVAHMDTARAEAALRAAGYTLVPGSRLSRPYRSDWRSTEAPVELRSLTVHHRDNPYTVDLHASLDLDFFGVRTVRFGTPAPEQLVAAPWAGPRATALPQPLLVAYLAAHASQGLYNLTMIRLTELVLVIRRDVGQALSWDELMDLLHGTSAERFVYPAFELAERLAPGVVDSAFRQQLARAATPALRAIVSALTPGTAQRLERLALNEQFMWGMTPIEHLRRAAHMLLPAGPRGSLRRLRRIYLDRAYRLLRGRVKVRSS